MFNCFVFDNSGFCLVLEIIRFNSGFFMDFFYWIIECIMKSLLEEICVFDRIIELVVGIIGW